MTAVKDMSTTTDPSHHKGHHIDDQENAGCADLVIVPTWGLDRLCGKESAVGRSAQSRCWG
jgi:hypothetical protein